jgi:hypothetical protein
MLLVGVYVSWLCLYGAWITTAFNLILARIGSVQTPLYTKLKQNFSSYEHDRDL